MLLSVSSTVGIVIDVLIVAILAIFALIGFKKGFFKSVLSMLSTIVVLVISVLGAGWLSNILNKIYDFTGFIAGKLCKSIASMGTFYSEPIAEGVSGADIVGAIPSSTNGFLKKLMSHVLKPLSASEIQGETVANIVSGAFASIIMLIISGIILFIALKIIIAIASRLFDNITRNRVFGATNKLLGLVFGAVKGFVVLIVFVIALTLLTVIPLINTKLTPIIQDHTKIARPLYNYTDEMVEKYVIDGKIVQKWIDNLWDNKYKGKGDDVTPPATADGSLAHPYDITLTESEGVYTATITIDFTSVTELYYKLNPSQLAGNFGLEVTVTDVEVSVMNTSDTDTPIVDLTSLSKDSNYLIKFTKTGTETSVEATITLTANT